MILVINTADESKVFIGVVYNSRFILAKTFLAPRRQSEQLLDKIDRLLKSKKISLRKIKGLAVVIGPGPFTALRIGAVTGNTLAWALKLPIVGLKLSEFKTVEQLAKLVSQKIKTKKRGIVLPFYDKEPNITKQK